MAVGVDAKINGPDRRPGRLRPPPCQHSGFQRPIWKDPVPHCPAPAAETPRILARPFRVEQIVRHFQNTIIARDPVGTAPARFQVSFAQTVHSDGMMAIDDLQYLIMGRTRSIDHQKAGAAPQTFSRSLSVPHDDSFILKHIDDVAIAQGVRQRADHDQRPNT